MVGYLVCVFLSNADLMHVAALAGLLLFQITSSVFASGKVQRPQSFLNHHNFGNGMVEVVTAASSVSEAMNCASRDFSS
jgi:hypothetical protein